MDRRRRWYAAAAFGALNTACFLLASGFVGAALVMEVPLLGLLLLALAIVAAHWCLAAVEDLLRITARDAAALLVRGAMAGSLVAAIVGGIAFGLEGWENALFGSVLAAFFGLFAGLALALVDVLVLTGIRLFVRGPHTVI